MSDENTSTTVDLTAEIVSAYVANNSVPTGELPNLIRNVHGTLASLGPSTEATAEAPPAELKPAVPIKKSVHDDHVVCLEDGKKFKSLKRHLHAEHGMTPQDYRTKWGLPKDYPMVAPTYAAARSSLAKTLGLGRKGGEPEADAAPAPQPSTAPEPEAAAQPKPRTRRKVAEPA